MNFYELLEVSPNASKEVIKTAYKTLSKKYHPDVQPESFKKQAENIFKMINEAYEILIDDEKRRQYDNQLGIHNRNYTYTETQDEAKHKSEQSNGVESNSQPLYIGFGGWLYFLAIHLIFSLISSYNAITVNILPVMGDKVVQRYSGVMAILKMEFVYYVFLIVYVLFALYLMYKRKNLFKTIMIGFYISILIFTSIDYLLITYFSELEVESQELAMNFIKALISCSIWIPYILKSKRVNNTYTVS